MKDQHQKIKDYGFPKAAIDQLNQGSNSKATTLYGFNCSGKIIPHVTIPASLTKANC